MLIYRVEDDAMNGPYRGHPVLFAGNRSYTVHSNMDTHPIPSFDMIPNGFCGFASLTQFYNWFNGDIKTLVKEGFHLVVLELDDLCVNVGERQVTFPSREAAKLLRTYSLRYACELAREEMDK